MPSYRFYKLNSGKFITAPGEDYDFDGDLPAMAHAKELANGHAISVWEGPRFVADVESESDSSADATPHEKMMEKVI